MGNQKQTTNKKVEMSGVPGRVSFSVTEPRFDKDTYWGRVQAIAAGVAFKNAFKTTSEIEQMQKILDAQKAKEQE